MVERAFTDTGRTWDQDLRDTLPDGLTEALPDLAPTVLFTAWSLTRRGYSAQYLNRLFNLTAQQSRMIITQARSSPPDRHQGIGPSDPR